MTALDDDNEDYDIDDEADAAGLALWLAGTRVVRAAIDNNPAAPLLINATIEHEAGELLGGMADVCMGTAYIARSLLYALEEKTGQDPRQILDFHADEARRKFGLPPQSG